MASAKGLKQVAYFDCAGGGQIRLDGTTAYIGHMGPPFGTSIIDVSDPANPEQIAGIEIPAGFHSHKVHARDGGSLLELETAEDDRGRVIGRQGRVAKALRAVLGASRVGADCRLDIVD